MSSVSETDGLDAPRLVDEIDPCGTAVVENVFVGLEDPVGKPVTADELPDVRSGIAFGAIGRQHHQRDVDSDLETARRHFGRDFGEVEVHHLDVAGGKDESGTLALRRTDGAEDRGQCGSLSLRSGRAGAALNQRRVILFLCPMRVSSANQISIMREETSICSAICTSFARNAF